MHQHNKSAQSGFTLIEMLVIAPIVILVITAFIAVMINMTGDVLANRERSSMTYNTQAALDRIEQDVKFSSQFLATTGAMTSPQGSGNNTTAFNSTTGATSNLLLSEFATTSSPVNTAGRSLVYYTAPSPNGCSNKTFNTPVNAQVIYFLTGSSNNYTLWRRTVLPQVVVNTSTQGPLNVCDAPWQRNSCADGSSGTVCKAKDEDILDNVSSFSVQYCLINGTCSAANSPTTAAGVQISLSAAQSVAGVSNTITLTLNAVHLNTTS